MVGVLAWCVCGVGGGTVLPILMCLTKSCGSVVCYIPCVLHQFCFSYLSTPKSVSALRASASYTLPPPPLMSISKNSLPNGMAMKISHRAAARMLIKEYHVKIAEIL
ncbi:hypothetical protein E2C01_011561 [Portunus trituberculatus]|uniref:Uncharacterized protein n=1 Tax=Portunus trituberculatus TaxID=210409 RepID=A0A5B7DBQ4_PORTR|nr:hypothetical protein [Portunus trituberculatus]